MTEWVVVGAGTAGCVVAARLSEDPANEVTVLEAGDDRGPLAATFLLERARPGAMWAGEYPIGRGLGGTSAVNGGVLSGDVAGLVATALSASPLTEAELGPVDRALLAAAADATPALLARREGRPVSVAECYLEPARSRPNLSVRTGVEVDRVLRRGPRAIGVVTVDGERLAADRVVLCGGAIQSPALLLRSGIANGEPGIGLVDHPGGAVDLTLRTGVDDPPAATVIGAALRRGAAEYLSMNRVGASSTGAALLVGLLSGGRNGAVGLDPSGRAVVTFTPLRSAVEQSLDAAIGAAASLVRSEAFAVIVESWGIAPGHGAYAHATSTCAAGRVVDENGAVLGCAGLFVADASVLRTLPASGTYVPVVLEAERLTRRWSTSR